MQEHVIGVNLFNICVRYDITISRRQEDRSRGHPRVPDSEYHSGTECGFVSLTHENAIFTIEIQFGVRGSLLALDPLNLLS